MNKARKLLFPILFLSLGITVYFLLHKESRVNEFVLYALDSSLTFTLKKLQVSNETSVSEYLTKVDDQYYSRESFAKATKVRSESIRFLDTINAIQKQLLSTIRREKNSKQLTGFDSLIRNKAIKHLEFLIDQIRYNKDELRQMLPLYNSLNTNPSNLFGAASSRPDLLEPLFTALQINVLLSEEIILHEIYREGSPGCVLGFDEIQAIAVPRNSFALEGQPVETDIFLATYNKAINPVIQSREVQVARIENGVALVEKKCKDLGVDTIDGIISLNIDNETVSKPWSIPYIVVAPGISVKIDKSNVMHEMVPNAVHIDIPGYAKKDLSLSAKNSLVRKIDDGHYEVIPPKNTTKDFLYVDAINNRGKKTTVAGLQVRVKKMRMPACTIAGIYSGEIYHAQLLADAKLRFVQTDSTVSMSYQIISYEMTKISSNKNVEGPLKGISQNLMTNRDIAAALNTLKPGDKLFFFDINCIDENGNTYELPGCVLKII